MEAHLNAEKLRKITVERVEKFLSKSEWTDINLTSKIYGTSCSDSVKLQVWSVPNTDPNFTDKVSYAEMLQQPGSAFKPAKIGDTFGPEWSTHWLKAQVTLPAGWEDKEVHLVWDSTGEALLFKDGEPFQAFNGSTGNDRRDFHVLTKKAKAGETWNFEIEMVSCGMFGNNGGSFLSPPNGSKVFTLKKAQIQIFNPAAYALWTDLSLILEIAKELPSDDVRGWQAVDCMRQVVNACHTEDERTWPVAQAIATAFLSQKNGEAQHQVMATGHCHIDTAWLWPYSETRRKVARSWATQCTIMDAFSIHKFTASQAQQFEWMKEKYPGLFKRIQEKVKAGQFIPIGATWIEMDCNIPSGESFARQFLFGQRSFQSNFGITCKVFWLPDTFGYSSQLPQIMKQSECDFFLTQKLSWNNINKFPHNTFYWQGLDGTNVLSHFPPADTYVSEANVRDLVQGTKNFKTKDKSNRSMMLFGYGDGGGGPDPHHLARLSRLSDVAGVPKVSVGHPEAYFRSVLKDEEERLATRAKYDAPVSETSKLARKDIPKWVGELYFELHRGTYTTHARNKLGNRSGEFQLQAIELLSAMASTLFAPHPLSLDALAKDQATITHLWKLLLLNQFHDVLPGTSIELVYKDSAAHYAEIQETSSRLIQAYLEHVAGSSGASYAAFNTLCWPRTAVVEVGADALKGAQVSADGKQLVVISAPGMGLGASLKTAEVPASHAVVVTEISSGVIQLENEHISAKIDAFGRISSLFHKATQHESIASGELANRFIMFDDVPFFWDAWDVEIYHTEKPVAIAGYSKSGTAKIVERGPLRAVVEFTLAISDLSIITQRISLDAVSDILTFGTHVDWHENRKFLKVEFPLAVHANQVWYSTQFGCQSRPNHKNTTWDLAKFEVCGHHWADVNEFGFGVALLNDCKYGYSCEENVLRLSLLRSSKQPDATADMGMQAFKYGLLAHAGNHADAQLARRGLEFNVPLRLTPSEPSAIVRSFFEVDPSTTPSLVLETVKLPENSPADKPTFLQAQGGQWIILRLWESAGARGHAKISTSLNIKQLIHLNILENPVADSNKTLRFTAVPGASSTLDIAFLPFEVITIACKIE